MAIPTRFDRDLAVVDDLAAFVMIKLRTLHHGGKRDVTDLREALRAYVDHVMALAEDDR